MPRYVAFHKPYGVLSQFTPDHPGQRTLAEFGLPGGIYAAGRLDRDSEGLMTLTDDGPFIDRLLDPRNAHERAYLVQVEGLPTAEAIDHLSAGVRLKDFTTKPARVELLASEPDLPPRDPPIRQRRAIPTAWLCLTLTEGRNRQVRRMTAAVGFPTLRLVRVRIARLELKGLDQGAWRAIASTDILP